MKKRIFTFILALVAIATTAGAQTKYDIWVGGVQVTSANASNITGGDIKSGTVKYDAKENELILTNATITRSGTSKQGIRNQVAGLTITFFGTNTITTDNSCALRCDANTYLWMMPNSKTTFTEKKQEAFYVTGGKSLFITGGSRAELYVNSTNEYAVEGEKGTETVTFQGGPVVTLNGKKGSLVKLGKVVFTESQNKSTSVTLKATNNTSYPQVQNVKAWEEEGYNHIDAPIGGTSTHPAFNASSKTILKPNGLSGNLTSYDIVINEDVVQLNSTHFPDANFLSYVKEFYTTNKNGYPNRGFISKAMTKTVKSIGVANKNISNLKGIEHFTALDYLNCQNNQLTSLDVSGCTALTYLDCNSNQLTSLNVTGCTALTTLGCGGNKLTSLDVSKNTALTTLGCGGNQLTSLDVSKNTALTDLYCSDNKLTSLDVSKNTALTELDCSDNQLTSLKVLPSATSFKRIDCYHNKLTGQSVKNFVNSLPNVSDGVLRVQEISSDEGNVFYDTEVEIAKGKGWNVKAYKAEIWVSFNGIPTGIEINATNFPDTKFRSFVSGTTIDKDRNGYLRDAEIADVTEIDVWYKSIANLKGIEHFTALTELYCSDNKLTDLDVSKNTALTTLGCGGNQLTSLDVSKNTALTKLYCSNNQLTSLDVSKNTKLLRLDCYGNQIKGDKMQALVNSLPKVTNGKFYVINTKSRIEQNVITKSQVAIATGKGWKVYDYNSNNPVEYAGSDETPTSIDNGQLIIDNLDGDWYSIDGKKLQGEPTKKGVYIIKGKKVKK